MARALRGATVRRMASIAESSGMRAGRPAESAATSTSAVTTTSVAAQDALGDEERRAPDLGIAGLDDDDIVHARGQEVVDRHAPDDEDDPVAAGMERRLVDAGDAQEVRPPRSRKRR